MLSIAYECLGLLQISDCFGILSCVQVTLCERQKEPNAIVVVATFCVSNTTGRWCVY